MLDFSPQLGYFEIDPADGLSGGVPKGGDRSGEEGI